MDEMTELWVLPAHQGQGIGRGAARALLAGRPDARARPRWWWRSARRADLTLYTEFGVMPVARPLAHAPARVDRYLEQRAQEVDATEPGVHVLTPDRAVEEWKRLEPAAIGHDRPPLHEFFGRTRTCLATVDDDGRARRRSAGSSGQGEIGPGGGRRRPRT